MLHIAGPQATSFLYSLDNNMISPNAVDLRLDRVLKVCCSEFVLSDESKTVRGTEEVFPKNEWYTLWPGAYEITLGNVKIGTDEAGFVLPRSTLNRNGIIITTGLFDSGYQGAVGSVMHVTTDIFKVKKGTRVAQFLLFKAESLKQYDGQYGFDSNGNPKQEEQKYHKE